MSKARVVVVGGGFGGLQICKRLSTYPDVEVRLIDKKNHHLFQPLLYEVATCGLTGPQIAQPLRAILRGCDNVTTYMDRVERIDFAKREVYSADNTYGYDYLVLAMGARTGYFGQNQWAQHTMGLKNLQDAMRMRSHVLRMFEEAEMTESEEERQRKMTFVVVGGGPTGVEMAGALAELARHVLRRNFRRIDPTTAKVILVERSDRLLTMYDPTLSEKAKQQIEELGVEVRCGVAVTDIRHEEIDLNGNTLRAGSIIWGAGVEAVGLTRQLGLPLDRAGRVQVEPDCSIAGHPEVFAIGDVASLVDATGKPVPGVSPAAIQMGKYVSQLIVADLQGKRDQASPFVYRNKGNMATIGRSRAIAEIGSLKLSGWPAWSAWLLVHLLFLVGFKSKMFVLLDWTYRYFTYRRSARVIIDE